MWWCKRFWIFRIRLLYVCVCVCVCVCCPDVHQWQLCKRFCCQWFWIKELQILPTAAILYSRSTNVSGGGAATQQAGAFSNDPDSQTVWLTTNEQCLTILNEVKSWRSERILLTWWITLERHPVPLEMRRSRESATVTFDLWPPKRIEFIFESRWTFVPKIGGNPLEVLYIHYIHLYISFRAERDGRTDIIRLAGAVCIKNLTQSVKIKTTKEWC